MTDNPTPPDPVPNAGPPQGESAANSTEQTANVPAWRPDTPPLAPTSDYQTPAPTGPPPPQQHSATPAYQAVPGYPQQPPGGYGAPGYPAPPGYPVQPGYPAQPGYPYGPPSGYVPTGPGPAGWQHSGNFAPMSAQVGRPNRRRGVLIAGGLVAVAAAGFLVTGFWAPGFLLTPQLDVNAVQDGVERVLTDTANGYGATNVTDVRCNDGANPTIKSGATFNCDVTINGDKRQVKVTFGDDSGTYWVGGPT